MLDFKDLFKLKPEYEIRKMTEADIDQVVVIEAAAYGEVHWTRDNFLAEIKNSVGNYRVLVKNKTEVLGYIGGWVVIDEMHVTTVATAEEYLRKGVAETLLTHAIFHAMQNRVKCLTLEVRISNIKAQKLYEKYNFKHQGIRKRYYEDNHEAALILWTENINTEEYQKLFIKNIVALVERCEFFEKMKLLSA
ncbi:MAG: ribosomal protein S18-alanine N-acetyltransferase [Candidatus Caenarcaniphilales bacterium]|nr:ribosomal protein S18-alanine N-acetyltransferase [Candidatus Caenarcaniphilales bacterium]